MQNNVIERIVLGKPLHRGLRPHFFHARHVIHAIADEREIVHDTLGGHAEFGHYPGYVELFIAHGVDQLDVRIDQLRHVFIAGGDHGVHAVFFGFMRQGADHIVGFDARYH